MDPLDPLDPAADQDTGGWADHSHAHLVAIPAEEWAWVQAQGGAAFVLALIRAARQAPAPAVPAAESRPPAAQR